jgi:hypothetical protein
MSIALILAAATSVSAMFSMVRSADGCGRIFLCLSVRFSSALLLVARCPRLLDECHDHRHDPMSSMRR